MMISSGHRQVIIYDRIKAIHKTRENYHGSTLSKLDTDASKGLKPQTIHITLRLLICAQGTSLKLVIQDSSTISISNVNLFTNLKR